MKKVSTLFKCAEANQNADATPTNNEHELVMAELDHVTGAGGNSTSSSNPVGD